MSLRNTLSLIAVLLFTTSFAQKTVTWDDLARVSFSEVYNNDLGAYVNVPNFSKSVQFLDGKKVSIKGHVIPIDVENNDFVLSAFPFASCFFCGNSGPETVVQLKLKGKGNYQTDEYLTFTGTLKLNSDNIYDLNYILVGAQVLD